jgi:hypothetical protein
MTEIHYSTRELVDGLRSDVDTLKGRVHDLEEARTDQQAGHTAAVNFRYWLIPTLLTVGYLVLVLITIFHP